jgi:hypothetical protein
VKRSASHNVMRNRVEEVRNQGIKLLRVFIMDEAKPFEGAGNQGLIDFGLAVRRELTSPLKRELPKAVGKSVSPAIERLSLLTGGNNFIGKNDLISRVEAGEPAEIKVEAGGHMSKAPAGRV